MNKKDGFSFMTGADGEVRQLIFSNDRVVDEIQESLEDLYGLNTEEQANNKLNVHSMLEEMSRQNSLANIQEPTELEQRSDVQITTEPS